MPRHPAPDPHELAALAERVNEIFRGMAFSSEERATMDGPDYDAMPDPGPRVLAAVHQVLAFACADPATRRPITVYLTGQDAGELLEALTALAVDHQATHHPDQTWVGCHPVTEAVHYACQLFLAAATRGA